MSETLRRIVLAARPEGAPTEANFRLEAGPMPQPRPGQVLVRVIWLSLDPYMRGRMDASRSYAKAVEVGETMEGGAVGEVLASNSPTLNPGDFVFGMFGWASHAVAEAKLLRKLDPRLAPISAALGALGMPGFTAWYGFNELGRPRDGETIVVSAATGAVGSMVGQLAKAKGLRTVGVAGGADKCAYATAELGFDACLDHRAADLPAQLRAACPKGVDIYFENVGGVTLDAVISQMNVNGRIPICGMISWYNLGGLGAGAAPEGGNRLPKVWRTILVQRLKVAGFIISDHWDRLPAFLSEVGPMVAGGRVRYRESISEGLESAPGAFLSLLSGGNFGKQLVRVSADPTRAA
jgi:hypothetical protein